MPTYLILECSVQGEEVMMEVDERKNRDYDRVSGVDLVHSAIGIDRLCRWMEL